MATPFTLQNFLALLPVVITCGTATLAMLAIAFKRHHFVTATITVMGLFAALLSVFWVGQNFWPQSVTELFVVDGFACFYMGLVLIAALACVMMAGSYMETHPGNREELYLLLTLSTAGALVIVCSKHMASFFIGLEILSVPLYGLVAYSFQRSRSLEAGIKYLVLSAVATAFLLFGMALLYAQTGSMSFAGIEQAVQKSSGLSTMVAVGCVMILIGLAFKLSLAPFHMWTPDVYEGAPAPVTAFLATVSKTAVFAAFLRLTHDLPLLTGGAMHEVIAVLAALSIIGGNLLALLQTNLKRLLGYSSIAHFGYLLLVVLAGTPVKEPVAAIYLVTYVVSSLAAFGVIVLVSSPYQGADVESISRYRGLYQRRPLLTIVLTMAMLSLAGIPLTAGFIGKFQILMIGVDAGMWWLLGALVVGSAIALYYYLRVMITLYTPMPEAEPASGAMDWGRLTGALLMLMALLGILIVGVYPQPLISAVLTAGM